MGKFDRRDKMPGHGSFGENRSNVSSSAKMNFKSKKYSRSVPYFSDPLIIPRINQYLADNKDKVYVDINDMVTELQCRYKDYARRKRNAFKQLVEKAFSVVLQQCGMSQGNLGQVGGSGYAESTENSSSEVEECNISDGDDKSVTSSNNQLVNLYKQSQLQAMTKQFQRCPNANAELIDLSSDDDSSKKKDLPEDKAENEAKSNGLQKHSLSKETTVTLVQGSAGKSGSRMGGKSSDRPQVTITRKRKMGVQSERNVNYYMKKRKESIMQESSVTFADFGGNTRVLEEVCKLILHIQHPEIYRQIGVSSPRGFLLHGPPGCGKTLLANAIAGELEVNLIKISAPELVGGVSGESEERIRDLFERAIESAPCVLFIDEVDAVTPNRQNAQREMERRIVAQLLTCLDELNNKPNGDQVLVIGATNRPDSLDPALRRAGRFDREVCLGIPDLKAREQILKVLCGKLRLSDNFSFEELSQNTPGFVGADLLALTREAAMAAINRAFGALQNQRRDKNKKNKKAKLEKSLPKITNTDNETVEDSEAKVVEVLSKQDDETMEVDIIDSTDEKKTTESEKVQEDEVKSKTPEISEITEKTNEEVTNLEEECKKDYQKNEDNKNAAVEVAEKDSKDKEEEEKKKENKGKEISPGKDDSDMDIAETVSEESVNCENKDVDVCKDGSTKTLESDDESDIEIIPEMCDSSPPTLDTLLLWLRDTPPLTYRQLKSICITRDDFIKALRSVQPSAKREGFATVPDVTWDDIGSLADIREELKMSILGPVKYRKQFEQLGLTAPAGILICGPPGCGKTLLAKAVANEAGINFISVKGPELLNMYVGESERAVRQCFQRARNSAPCVIFFDELDALCPRRSDSGENGASMRVVNQMLTEMDGIEDRKEVYLMAATNRPDIVDPAVLRPGRLDKILYVGLPEPEDRVDILKALTKRGTRPTLDDDVDLSEIAKRPECNGYSGADLAALVREAGVQALKDIVANSQLDSNTDVTVSAKHFERALKHIRPSVSAEDRRIYESQRKKYTGGSSI